VCADDKVLLAPTKDLQTTITELNYIIQVHNIQISESKTKAMGMQGKYWRRVRTMLNNKIIEQASSFTYIRNKIPDNVRADSDTQLCKYNLNGVIHRHFKSKMNTFYSDYTTVPKLAL
jgi:hypothetical protein